MAKFHATTSPEMSDREKRNMERVRKIVPHGMVLLENDGILPLKSIPKKIALYGSGARRTVKGGTGSGDVNSRQIITVEDGLEQAGMVVTTKAWMDLYDKMCKEHMDEHMAKIGELLAKEGQGGIAKILDMPYQEPEEPIISDSDMASGEAELAVYVLSRNSGEGKDRKVAEGDYLLSDHEKENIERLAESYSKFIVVLNVGGVIDTGFLRNLDGINAILLMSQVGNVGGLALADVLTGKAYPTGHLTTTWAEKYSDYPSADTFSYRNHDTDDEYYEDGIYVGYRYFDTFNVKPAYPFGYGLSYTEFALHDVSTVIREGQIRVSVEVENTGDYPGKEVIQVYYSAPDGKIEKPYQELAGYKKTQELLPGKKELVEISFDIKDMASYDEESASYVIENGEYIIRVGTHSRNTRIAAVLYVDESKEIWKLENKLKPDCVVKELSKKGVTPYSYQNEEAELNSAVRIDMILNNIAVKSADYSEADTAVSLKVDKSLTLDDVKSGKITIDELINSMDVAEMATLCVGTSRGGLGSASVIGAASAACPGAAGDTTSELIDTRKVPNMVLADGPAGLRLSKSFVVDREGNLVPGLGESALGGIEFLLGMQKPERPEDAVDYYQYCTAIPIATMLAQTWDEELIEEAGDIVGEEMEELGIHLWLAPGMNIHRNPLCGRNFEYYSEDPLISGKCAAADTRGVQKHKGKGTTIKHFALNNQEDNRAHLNAHCGERAIREIYLRGFEIAIREAGPLSLMTSYNLLNGIHTANHYELITSICRDEWGYPGLIMTDWGTTGGGDISPDYSRKYGFSSAAGCIKAGNDLIMPGSQKDVDDIIYGVEHPEENLLTLGELRNCARRIINTILATEE